MNEKMPPQENNKDQELEALLKAYPLPEKHQDKAELALELKKILNSLLDKDASKNNFNTNEAVKCFIDKLKQKYVKNIEKNKKGSGEYYLLHLVIGSTGVKTTEFDFPGEDSIEKFLRLRELLSRLDD